MSEQNNLEIKNDTASIANLFYRKTGSELAKNNLINFLFEVRELKMYYFRARKKYCVLKRNQNTEFYLAVAKHLKRKKHFTN